MANPYASKKSHFETLAKATPEAESGVEQVQVDSTPSSLGVAEMSVSEVMDIVGEDKDLAREALSEEKSGKNRVTLITKLEDVLND